MQTMKQQEWIEFSWRNNVYKAKFSVDTRSEHGLHLFNMIITVHTLLSLFQHIKRFKLYV